MKIRMLLPILVCLHCITVVGQNELTIGKRDTLFSKHLNETREVWVSVPSTYNPDYEKKDYPVLYVLDGPTHFLSVVGMVDRFSTNLGSQACPQMIVVGLVNTNRNRDLFPKEKLDDFGRFLEEELIPYIDNNYPTKPHRVIMGHSLGGIRVVHSALYQEELFNGFIAIDASLGQERNRWYTMAEEEINKLDLGRKNMFVATAWTMGNRLPKRDLELVKQDTTDWSNHMRTQINFSELMLSKNKAGNEAFAWKYYPEETHGSVTQLATYDGITTIFNWYQNKDLGGVFNPNVPADSSVQDFKNHYAMLSDKMGSDEKPAESSNQTLINYLIYNKNDKVKGLAFAKYNLELYPESQKAKELYNIAVANMKPSILELLDAHANKPLEKLIKICREDHQKGEQATYNLTEYSLNYEGYILMAQLKYDEALKVFTINTNLYPESANVYDSLGECLLAMDRKDEAIEAYKKLIEIDPDYNPHAVKLVQDHEEKR